MINLDNKHLMMIEPKGKPAEVPVIDRYTRLGAAAFRASFGRDVYQGVHRCTGQGCSAVSDNADWFAGGLGTNSLIVHYLAHHREEVPEGELRKLEALDLPMYSGQHLREKEPEPSERELSGVHVRTEAEAALYESVRRSARRIGHPVGPKPEDET